MNKPLTVSLEGIGQCVLPPDILFPLQSSPHTLHSSCSPNTTGSWAGKHWGPSLPQSCTHLEATGFCHLSYPMHWCYLHQCKYRGLQSSYLPRLCKVRVAAELWLLPSSTSSCQRSWEHEIPLTHALYTSRTVLCRPGRVILFHPHLQSVYSVGPEINLLHFDSTFSPFLSPGWDGSLMLF